VQTERLLSIGRKVYRFGETSLRDKVTLLAPMFPWVLVIDLVGRALGIIFLVAGVLLGLGFSALVLYVSHRIAFPPWHDPHPGSQVLTQWRMPEAWATFTLDPETSLGLRYEQVAFRNRYGRILRGWWIPGAELASTGVEAKRPLVGLVCVHGGGRDRRAFMRQSVLFQRRGWSVLLFDCTGHGTSDARPALPRGRWPGRAIGYGTREWSDVADAIQYTRIRLEEQYLSGGDNKGEVRLVLLGTSQGAVSALYAAAHQAQQDRHGRQNHPLVDVLVAENPFTSPLALFMHFSRHFASPLSRYAAQLWWMRALLHVWVVCCTCMALLRTGNMALTCRMLAKERTRHPLVRKTLWMASALIEMLSPPERMDTPPAGGFDAVAEAIQALPCPVLITHGKKDWIVSYKHSMELYERARDPKELWISPEAGHTMLYHCEPSVFEARVCGFLEKHLFGGDP
jgi:pimeloyl-ACP methyl ester carboxylesterase